MWRQRAIWALVPVSLVLLVWLGSGTSLETTASERFPSAEPSLEEVKLIGTREPEAASIVHQELETDPAWSQAMVYLSSLGFDVDHNGGVTTDVEEALAEFQAEHSITESGPGPDTLASLKADAQWHLIRSGDTLSHIALLHGTQVETLRELNGLSGDIIRVGQQLLVPRGGKGSPGMASLTYVVRPGDTVSSLAQRYQVSVSELERVNGLTDVDMIRVGDQLSIPLKREADGRGTLPLSWPLSLSGRISSDFGWRTDPFGGPASEYHGGIDIAVPVGTPVLAAADGIVVEASWLGASGYAVIIDHSQGIRTSYSHNSKLLVQPGWTVRRGERIALSGSTGRSTGPHLDFRVRVNGELVSPLLYTVRP